MSKEFVIASMMICGRPNYLNQRLMISCCDAVWEPIEHLNGKTKQFFTDELGNSTVNYGGFLQMVDRKALFSISEQGLFSCFRCISEDRLQHVQVNTPKLLYRDLIGDLKPMGWDIATGNGWLSASCHGLFPINPFTGKEVDSNADLINEYGLFDSLDNCLVYCKKNNSQIPEHAPWFPVAIHVDKSSYSRLRILLQKESKDHPLARPDQ